MTGAFTNQANPNGVDLGPVGPSRAGMLMDASFSVGFTYGYSWCPASRDATQSTALTEGGSYLSAYGVSPPATQVAPLRGARLRASSTISVAIGAGGFETASSPLRHIAAESYP
jgi:hypothetical protein